MACGCVAAPAREAAPKPQVKAPSSQSACWGSQTQPGHKDRGPHSICVRSTSSARHATVAAAPVKGLMNTLPHMVQALNHAQRH
jgi:hypothetical protein